MLEFIDSHSYIGLRMEDFFTPSVLLDHMGAAILNSASCLNRAQVAGSGRMDGQQDKRDIEFEGKLAQSNI